MDFTKIIFDVVSKKEITLVALLLALISLPLVYLIYIHEEDPVKVGPLKEACLENVTEEEGELPVWPISEEEDFERGGFSNLKTGGEGDYLRLKEDAEGGVWKSVPKTWPGEVEYIYMDVDSNVDEGEMRIVVETGSEDFETIEESTARELSGGLESFGICDLNASESVRVSVEIESISEDKETTTLHGIWMYFRPRWWD